MTTSPAPAPGPLAPRPHRRATPWGMILLAETALVAFSFFATPLLPAGSGPLSAAVALFSLVALVALVALAAWPGTAALWVNQRFGRWRALLVGVLGYALLASIAMPGFHEDIQAYRNHLARVNARHTQRAVDAYVANHRGQPPATDGWLDQLLAPGAQYFDHPSLEPNSAWGRIAQRAPVAPASGLVGARAIAAGATPTPQDTVLGPGRKPTADGVFTVTTYGAIVYDMDPATRTYVIYAIGQRNWKNAVVAGWMTGTAEAMEGR